MTMAADGKCDVEMCVVWRATSLVQLTVIFRF